MAPIRSIYDFSLGVQFNNFNAPSIGYKKNDLNLSYIYKVELGNDLWFLPSVNVGFVSKNLNPSNLIFEDQVIKLLDILIKNLLIP